MAGQRLASPVDADVGEKTVLDLVLFAGARRQMTNIDFQPSLIGELLKFLFP